jgi:hypothetical protein
MDTINYTVENIETGRKTNMSYTPNMQDAKKWFEASDNFTFTVDLLEMGTADEEYKDWAVAKAEVAFCKMLGLDLIII